VTITGTAFGGNEVNAGNVDLNPGSLTSAAGDRIVVAYTWYDLTGSVTQTAGRITSTPAKTFTKDTEFLQTVSGAHLGVAIFSWVSDGTTLTQINVNPDASGGGIGSVGGSVVRIVSTVGTVTYDSTTVGTGTDSTSTLDWSAGGAVNGAQIGVYAIGLDNGASGTWTASSGYTAMHSFGNGAGSLCNHEAFKVNETGTPALSVAYNTTITSAIELFVSYQEPAPAGYTGPGVVRLEDNSEILEEVGNPPTFVAVGTDHPGTTTPINVVVPSGLAGDFLLLFWESDTPGDVAAASGYTAGLNGTYNGFAGNTRAFGFLYKFDNTTGGGTQLVTGLTGGGAFAEEFIQRYRGVDPNNPINVSNLDSTTNTSSNITTSRPDTVEVGAITDDQGLPNTPPAGGWTGRLTSAAANFWSGDRVQTPTGQTGVTTGWPSTSGGIDSGIIHLSLNGVPSTVLSPLHLVLEAGVEGSWTGSGTALTEAGFQVQLEDGSSKIVFEATDLTALVQEQGRYWLSEAGDHVLLESAGGGGSNTRNVTDTAAGTDAVSRVVSLSRSVSDAANGSDAVSRTSARARPITDTAAGTDTATRAALTFNRAIADAANGSDAVARVVSDTRAVSDAANGTDVAVGMRVYGRSVTDAANGTDAVSRGALSFARPITDLANGSDVVSRTSARSRAIADAANGSDAVSRSLSLPRTASDVGSGTDTASRGAQTFLRGGADAANGTDAATTGGGGGPRSVTDAANGSDSVTRIASHPRSIADTAAGTDAVTRTAGHPRSITETANGTDVASRAAQSFGRPTSDAANGTDTVTRIDTTTRAVSDTGGGTDTTTRTVGRFRTIIDIGGGTDVATRAAQTFLRPVFDIASGIDVATATGTGVLTAHFSGPRRSIRRDPERISVRLDALRLSLRADDRRLSKKV
jgi:hypothetical protein